MGQRSLLELSSPFGFNASEGETGLYPAIFGRDSLWTLLLMLEACALHSSGSLSEWTEESGSRILTTLAQFQGVGVNDLIEEQPGKIMHEFHSGELDARLTNSGMPFVGGRSYAGFDETFLFVIAERRYHERFPKSPTVARIRPSVERALNWIMGASAEHSDGLFRYRRRHSGNPVHQVWKDSFDSVSHVGFDIPPAPIAWIELQGYAYRALLDGAIFFAELGKQSESRALRRRAEALQALVDQAFWIASEESLAVAVDGHKQQVRLITSNPGHALWSGVVKAERVEAQVARMMRSDVLSPFGLRTLSSHSFLYAPFAYHRGNIWPFDNAIFASALLSLGLREEARTIIERVGRALLKIGSPVEVYVALDQDTFVMPKITTDAALTYRHIVPEPGRTTGRRGPQNRNQAWTAAALLFFGAALARLNQQELPID